MSRINNFKKNFKFDIIAHLITQLLQFINRIIFIKFLGEEILGLNGLYSSILSLISLSELGIGSAFNIFLYKPLHEKDYEKISAATYFFKKVYKIIIIALIVCGIIGIPFLAFITKTSISMSNVIVYYILYFCAVLSTYFTMTEVSLLFADQKHYIISKYTSITITIQNIIQFIVLFLFKNYIFYLIIQIVTNNLYNILIKKYVNKEYKYLKSNKLTLSTGDKKVIYSNIKNMIVYKMSCVLISATDNILISSIINVVSVGIYSVYGFISNALSGIFSVISTSMAASVGNIVVSEDSKTMYKTFSKIQTFYFITTGLCCVGLFVGSNDFITIFFGNKYTFDISVLIIIIINFFIIQVNRPILLYKECAGLFKEIKTINIICAILNIILSILLGKVMGLLGILLATSISRLTTTYWYEAKIVHSKVFNIKEAKFYIQTLKICLIIFVACFISKCVINNIIAISICNFIIKEFISCSIYGIIVLVCYYKDEDFNYYFNILKRKFSRKGKN